MTPQAFADKVSQVTGKSAEAWELKVFTAVANKLFPNGLQDAACNKLLTALKEVV